MWKKGNTCVLLAGMQIGAATMENTMEDIKKLKIKLPYNPGIPPLSIFPKKSKAQIINDIYTPMFIAT